MQLQKVFVDALACNQLPAFSTLLIGLYSVSQNLFYSLLVTGSRVSNGNGSTIETSSLLRLARIFAGLFSSSLSFLVLNYKDTNLVEKNCEMSFHATLAKDHAHQPVFETAIKNQKDVLSPTDSKHPQTLKDQTLLAGETIDMTLLLTVRALETLVRQVGVSKRVRGRRRSHAMSTLESLLRRYADSGIFAISAGTVMYVLHQSHAMYKQLR